LPQDLDLLSRPVTYITFQIKNLNPQTPRNVDLYFDHTAEIAVNDVSQMVLFPFSANIRLLGADLTRLLYQS
jgi:hypothetical protein